MKESGTKQTNNMGQRQRLSLYIPGSPPGALPQCTTYTPASSSSDRRRSLISLDGLSLGNLSSLKPTKAKLQKYWPGGKSPATGKNHPTSSTHDLSALIMLAGEQMGALGDPRRRSSNSNCNSPVLARRPVSCASPVAASARGGDDLVLQQHLELSLPKSATRLSRRSSIHRKPLPAGSVVPALSAPKRAPPPPPIPELSAVNFYSVEEPAGNVSELESPSSPIMPVSPVLVRRRAKTPVHRIGQLELAAQRRRNEQAAQTKAAPSGNMDGINRMSSVSTIAREYRELAVYAELDDVPAVPKIDPSYLLQQGLVELPATEMKHVDNNQYDDNLLGSPNPNQRHHRHRASASSLSDDGTVLGSEAGSSVGTCPSLTHSNSPGGESSEAEGEEDEEDDAPPALASLRFQIGLELLTKELSTAFAGQSSRKEKEVNSSSSSAGLQIWVMIEAYERLREQLDAKPTEENKQARDAIDSWIKALNTIHANMASEAAGDDSDYEENP